MARSKKIRVMISSRCNDPFPAGSTSTLTDFRKQLKADIEAVDVLGESPFEVWINEDAPPAEGTSDSWETCLQAVQECDVLLVLFNGNAGWAKTGEDIGICHAEYMEGLNSARGKVRLIKLPPIEQRPGDDGKRDERFLTYVDQQTPFRGGDVTTVEEAKRRVFQALTDALVTLTQRGVSAAGSSRFDMGQALDWSRLDFLRRKQAMEATLKSALRTRDSANEVDDCISLKIGNKRIALLCHAIPAAFTVSSAREMVGRPFLHDHEYIDKLTGSSGPVHIIACHRGATESQAISFLGFPDATVVTGPFGIYVSDEVQKVQFVFLAQCRDETQTRHALQRFLEWLEQTGEDDRLARRATSRTKIIKVIAKELSEDKEMS